MNRTPNRACYDLGIVGSGQLARMMLQAAVSLGISVRLLAVSKVDAAAQIWPDVLIGTPDDPDALASLCQSCRVVTFDHELVPVAAIGQVAATGVSFAPSLEAVAVAQDKRLQRRRFSGLGLPVPVHRDIQVFDELSEFANAVGYPLVLKAIRGGYDGRGVWIVGSAREAEQIWQQLSTRSIGVLAEEFVTTVAEYSQQLARGVSGEIVVYPLVETAQQNGMLHHSVAPADLDDVFAHQARSIAIAIAEDLQLVGMLAVELLFDGFRLLINEIAARPHNSGHYSIEACVTGQFEQHLRAVVGMPLGSPAMRVPAAVTMNLIGGEGLMPFDAVRNRLLRTDGLHLHWYGKTQRAGRKLGHFTVIDDNRELALASARRALAEFDVTNETVMETRR